MERPKIVDREAWLLARRELLAREKELTRARDAVNALRRRLPLVRVDKTYVFEGPAGAATSRRGLLELFEGRRQLIVGHVMFDPGREQACTGCSFTVDAIPHLAHFHARATSVALISRAAVAQLARFQRRMGWTIPWYSSLDSDFNYDFHATTDEAVAPVSYNYRDKAELERCGQSYRTKGEQPGVSVFVRNGSDVYHSYSTYGRGLDLLMTTYNYLDLTPLGRGEGWGGMPDLEGRGRGWLRHHDRYDESQEER